MGGLGCSVERQAKALGGFGVSDPIVFISHSRVKEGKAEALTEFSLGVWPVLEAAKPGTVFQYGYLDEGGGEVHFVHVFPDADAMDAHMTGAGERTDAASEYIEAYAFEVYGAPSETTLSALRQAPDVDLVVRPQNIGGYIRLGT
jgi:hypothetical protein